MYEVQTYTIVDGWVNTWKIDDHPMYFMSISAAFQELADFWAGLEWSNMHHEYDPDEYRIVPVDRDTASRGKIAP
jgi:hypothetical protein